MVENISPEVLAIAASSHPRLRERLVRDGLIASDDMRRSEGPPKISLALGTRKDGGIEQRQCGTPIKRKCWMEAIALEPGRTGHCKSCGAQTTDHGQQ
jgi:hypothetical protein